ncbi:MAG: hypothetical protein VX764_07055 [Planctomycetota bacterium]|nr:hypothetical protein [Planctomycetota bacterium]
MARKNRYFLLCVVSGLVWAVIADQIAPSWRGSAFRGGLLSTPLVGVVAGLVYLPAYRFAVAGRVMMSLLTLYLSTLLFGLAWGVTDALQELPGQAMRNSVEVVYQAIAASFYGVTMTGFVLLLWPLAFFNHWLVGRLATTPPNVELEQHEH